jgi:hypothetical protein
VISGSKFTVNNKILGYNTMAFEVYIWIKLLRNPEAVKELKKYLSFRVPYYWQLVNINVK